MKTLLVALAFVLSAALPASAQTAINPTTVTFTASADHATVVGATAVVTSYSVDVYQGATLVRSTDIGKPSPVNGDISTPLVVGVLAKNQVYTLKVVAIGPGGSAGSAASTPFAWLAAPGPVSNVRVQ